MPDCDTLTVDTIANLVLYVDGDGVYYLSTSYDRIFDETFDYNFN